MAAATETKKTSRPAAPAGATHAALSRTVLRLRNAFRARAATETAAPPQIVSFELSGPPPSNARDDGKPAAPLDVDEWVELLEQLPAGARLRLCGPKALDFDGLETLLLECGRRSLPVRVETDALELERRAATLFALGVAGVELTLYGPEEVDNRRLGDDEAVERAVRGALTLKGLSATGPAPRLVVTVEVGTENQDHIAELAGHALAVGADRVLVRCLPGEADPHADALVDGRKLFEQIDGLRKRYGGQKIVALPDLPARGFELYCSGSLDSVGPSRCLVPWRGVAVDPFGAVRLCPAARLGSVREDLLSALFNGARAREFRRRLRGGLLEECASCLGRFRRG